MPLRYLSLPEPQYVPDHNKLDPNLLSQVDQSIQQQGQQNLQYQRDNIDTVAETAMAQTQGLPEEFQQEASEIFQGSRSRLEEDLNKYGARNILPAVEREARRVQEQFAPYSQAAQQAQQYQERLKDVSEDRNVSTSVRNYLQSQAGFGRDEDGRPGFQAPNLNQLDNWRDLHEVARETISDVEANIEESPVHLQEGQEFYQRVKNKYRDFDQLQAVGVARLLNDRDAVAQMKLQLEADGIHFEGGIAKQMNEQGELEPITTQEDGQTYQMTAEEAIEREAVRTVNPAAAARTMAQQTFSYTSQNKQYFNALSNDAGGEYITYNRSTVAGINPVDNPVQLSNEIEGTYDNIDRLLTNLEEQGIVQKTSEAGETPEYRVLDEGRYNGYSGQIRGLKNQIQQMERQQERLQLSAFNYHHGENVDEANLEDYMYAIQEGNEEYRREEELNRERVYQYITSTMDTWDIPPVDGKRLDSREVTNLAIDGETSKSLGVDSYYKRNKSRSQAEKLIRQFDQKLESIRDNYDDYMDRSLSRLSPEYRTYAELLKEDAKGRVVDNPVMRSTNDDVIEAAELLMQDTILAGSMDSSSEDLKWFNTNKAHESLIEDDIEGIESFNYGGFSWHPDTGEEIILYSAVGEDGKTKGMVYVPSSESFRRKMPINNQHAKENYYNNALNVIGSQPSREGKVNLLLEDIDPSFSVEVKRPIRKHTDKGTPIVRDDEAEFEFIIRRGNDVRRETFATPSEASGRLIELEENIRRAVHERQQQ